MSEKYSFLKAFIGIYRTPATFATLRNQGKGRAFFHFVLLFLISGAVILGVPCFRFLPLVSGMAGSLIDECGGIVITKNTKIYPIKSPEVSREIMLGRMNVSYVAPSGEGVTTENLVFAFAAGGDFKLYWTINALIAVEPYEDNLSYFTVRSFPFGGMWNSDVLSVQETRDFISSSAVAGNTNDDTLKTIKSSASLVWGFIAAVVICWLILSILLVIFKSFDIFILVAILSLFALRLRIKSSFSELLVLAFYSWMPVMPLSWLLYLFDVNLLLCHFVSMGGALLVFGTAVFFTENITDSSSAAEDEKRLEENKNE